MLSGLVDWGKLHTSFAPTVSVNRIKKKMKIAKEHLTVKDWQFFYEGEKITEAEFESLVNQIDDISLAKDIPSLNSDSKIHAYYFSKQDPNYKTIFYLNPAGYINFDWPHRYRDELFIVLDKMTEISNYLLLREVYEENKTVELNKSEYSQYLSKEYKTLPQKVFSEKSIGEEYRWLCIKTTKIDELKQFLNLDVEDKITWDDALDKVYSNGFIIVPKGNILTIVGPILNGLKHLVANTGQNHIKRKIELVKKVSSKFGDVGYFMVSYKYGTGECYLASKGKLNYGQYWVDGELEEFGNKSYLDGLYFKGELDISKNLFVDVRDFNRLKLITEKIDYYKEINND